MTAHIPNPLLTDRKLLFRLYKDLAQPGVQQVGIAFREILRLMLFPVSRLPKYMNDRLDIVLQNNLDKFRKRLEKVPPEQVSEVPPELGVPILNRLSFTKDESLSELFLNLLTKASVRAQSNLAHPSFIEKIANLTPDEARLLLRMHRDKVKDIPFIVLRFVFEPPNYLEIAPRLTGYENTPGLLYPQNTSVYFENLVSLGLLECIDTTHLADNKHYQPLLSMYDPIAKQAQAVGHNGKQYPVDSRIGYYHLTGYGRMFLDACVEAPSEKTQENSSL